MTVVRVYALHNRNPVILWLFGTIFVFIAAVCAALVRAFAIFRTEGQLLNVLHQRWIGVLGNGMVPGNPPTPLRCIPYRTDKQCVFIFIELP